MSRPTEVVINLTAIKANCRLIKSLAPSSKILAVVKADAYGHGSIEVAKVLAPEVDMLTVSSLEEALTLRKAGVSKSILLLEGFFEENEIELAVAQNCEFVIHSEWQVELLVKTPLSKKITIWLKVDSGMHRLGIEPAAVAKVYAAISKISSVEKIVIMTHFSSADDAGGKLTKLQLGCFHSCIESLLLKKDFNVELSIANSAGVMAWPESRVDWNRAGIALYGLSPFETPMSKASALQPAMTFQSKVIALRQIKEGESVGYGNTWTAARLSTIATVAVGYGDGYPRNAKSGTPVLINDRRAPLVGRVSMDLISVDVTDLTDVEIGDQAILWGNVLTANEVAGWADTIGYELVTRMPQRAKRVFIR